MTVLVFQQPEQTGIKTQNKTIGQPFAATITGDDGRFVVDALPKGHYIINTQTLGFEPYRQTITLGPSQDIGQITLETAQEELDQVTITAKTTQKIPEHPPRAQSIELSNYSVILGHGKDRFYRPW